MNNIRLSICGRIRIRIFVIPIIFEYYSNTKLFAHLWLQSTFPLLQKLGLAEKSRKGPTIGSVWSLAGSKIGSFPENWLFFVLGHFWNGTWRPARILILPLSATDQNTRKNVSLGLGCFKFQCVFFGHPYGRVQGGLKKAVLSSGNEAAHEIHPDHY